MADWDMSRINDPQPCGCSAPTDAGAGYTIAHDPDCPRFWGHLHDARAIAAAAAGLAALAELEPGVVRPDADRALLEGLARRARELGIEDV